MPVSNRINSLRVFVFLVFALNFGANALAQDAHKSLVQISVASATVDHLHPWHKGYTSDARGSGVIIDGHRILTAAHVVDNAVMLDVRRVGSDKLVPATVLFHSDERDLAILSVSDPDFFKDSEALSIGAMPRLGEAVTVWGFPTGGDQMAVTKGIVSRIDFEEYVHSGHSNLVVQVDAAINGGASGGAAIVNGKLAGINFQGSDELENVGFIIPAPVVQQFLDDIADGQVDGVPEIALWLEPMSNPQLRAHFGLVEHQSGLLITRVTGLEAANNIFKDGDIILTLDGESVADDGTVAFPAGDRINVDWLLTQHQIGDVIPVTVLRNGEVKTLDYRFQYNRQQSLPVVHHYSGFKPEFEVIGGLVFQELSADYIHQAFEIKDIPAWIQVAGSRYQERPLDEKQRLVFLSTILPDEINRGYQGYEDQPVVSVNGKPVRSIDDLRLAMKDDSDSLVVVFGDEGGGEVVFNKKALAERESAIRKQYGY